MRGRGVVFVQILLVIALSPVYATQAPDSCATSVPLVKFEQVCTTSDGFNCIIRLPAVDIVESPEYPDEISRFVLQDILPDDYPEEPVLPIVSGLFRIPPQSAISIDILDAEYTTYSDITTESFFNEVNFSLSFAEDSPDRWLPEEIVDATSPAIMHDFRVAGLHLSPVQVNPARHEVRIYSDITIAVHYYGVDDRNQLTTWPTTLSETFLPFYRQLSDWDDAELDEYRVVRGSVQVVSTNEALTLMEDWITWKKQRGWDLAFLTPEDVLSWTSNDIRTELQARWNAAEVPFDYIVIVGDATGSFVVPPGTGFGDHAYGLLAGDDFLLDCAIGRISVENASELVIYTNKVLSYEKHPYLDNQQWFTRGSVSATSSASGISTIYTGRYVRNLMLSAGYTQVDTAWYTQGTQFWINHQDIMHLNNGVSLYHHRGYQDTGLNPEEINELANDFMTPMVIDLTCRTGDWLGDGISEAWMRAGTASVPRGAIAAMGMHEGSTHTRFNNALAGGAWFSILQQKNPSVGQAGIGAKFNMYTSFCGHQDEMVHNFATWCNIMGDPTVYLWTGSPKTMLLFADSTIAHGQNGYHVTLYDPMSSEPVENAWVTMSSEVGDSVFVVSKNQTNAGGQCWLDLNGCVANELKLFITAQHYLPYEMDVSVQEVAQSIVFADVVVVDNGQNGTTGNSNGIAEAGETIGLLFELENRSDMQQNQIEISVTTDDPYIAGISGTGTLQSIQPRSSAFVNGVVLVELSPATPDGWNAYYRITINADLSETTDIIPLEIQSFKLALIQAQALNDSGNVISPGETGILQCLVANVGNSSALDPVNLVLHSDDPFISIGHNVGVMTSLAPSQTAMTSQFEISIHPEAFKGHRGNLYLTALSTNNMLDTLYFDVTIGEVDADDPIGPDLYGHYAFDNTDTLYYEEYAPDFTWIEINPDLHEHLFLGENLCLQDTVDNQDTAVVIQLPFPVRYYGETYSEMTIAVNGFVAMGNQADMPLQRNWTIPSPLGPSAMIAPYWDERKTDDESGIFYYHDAWNGRIIVEWYRVLDAAMHNPCTFELILYQQPEPDSTWTNDNDILFQYRTMNHSQGNGADVYYFTTGIENQTQDDGLQLAYWNSYTPGMPPVENGRAVLFTTNVMRIMGSIEGTISSTLNEAPIEGALVVTDDGQASACTNANGYYCLERVVAGRVDLEVFHDCFNSKYIENIAVDMDEPTEVNISLYSPDLLITPPVVIDTIHTDEDHTLSINLYNPGDGLLEYDAGIRFQGENEGMQFQRIVEELPTDDNDLDDMASPWDWAYSFSLSEQETRNRGLVFDGRFFWVTGSNGLDVNVPNQLYQYDRYGAFIRSFDQPVGENMRSDPGIYGLTSDGDFLYGVDGGWLYRIDKKWELEEGNWQVGSIAAIDSFETPVNPARYLAYDPDSDLFWMGDYGIDIYAVNRQGSIIAQYPQDFFPRGASWFAEDPDGFNLYFICQANGSNQTSIVKMNPENGDAVEIYSFIAPAGNVHPSGIDISGQWNPLVWVIATIIDCGEEDGLQVWTLSDNLPFFTIEQANGVVIPGTASILLFNVDGSLLNQGVYRFYTYFKHNACSAHNNWAYFTIVAPDTVTQAITVAAQPVEWEFSGVYPNPFNPTTTIAFSLKQNSPVHATLYDILGREVATVIDEIRPSGHHQVAFDGSNLASGMYFLHFQAGPLQETRKLLLLK